MPRPPGGPLVRAERRVFPVAQQQNGPTIRGRVLTGPSQFRTLAQEALMVRAVVFLTVITFVATGLLASEAWAGKKVNKACTSMQSKGNIIRKSQLSRGRRAAIRT